MKIHLLDTESERILIRAHTADSIAIRDITYTTSLAVSPTGIITDWGPGSPHALQSSDLEILAELEPELILLGTGQQQVFPDQSVLKPIIDKGVGYEIMNTGAACRTFNILVAEGRIVVAGLIL